MFLAQLALDLEWRHRIAFEHLAHRLDQRDNRPQVRTADREQVGASGDAGRSLEVN